MAFILAVNVLDIFLTCYYSDSILDLERNPIARLLIFEQVCDLWTFHAGVRQRLLVVHTNVAWLVTAKVVGLLAVQRIFAGMLASGGRFFVPVILGVALFHVWLLMQFLN